MTERRKSVGMWLSLAGLIVAIVLVSIGHGPLSVRFFVPAGIGFGGFGPPGVSDSIHGASDST